AIRNSVAFRSAKGRGAGLRFCRLRDRIGILSHISQGRAMVRRLIEFSLDNPLLVTLFGFAVIICGGYAFLNVNIEAYPDPAPAIIEVVAQRPGWSAEEMARWVTTPIEVALAGMPGLTSTRSKSLFGLSHLRNQFDYGIDYERAKQEVINRLGQAQLPDGVTPIISPASPVGEIYRYTLLSRQDETGNGITTLAVS